MDANLKYSEIAIVLLMLVAVTPTTASDWNTTPVQFQNGSHLYEYLYGGRTLDESQEEGDTWAHLIDLFNTVACNKGRGGPTNVHSHRIRRQSDSTRANVYGQPGHGARSSFGYQRQDDEMMPEAEAEEKESLPFMGDLAFSFPLLTLDIPFTGIEIPMFDYDSRDYYD